MQMPSQIKQTFQIFLIYYIIKNKDEANKQRLEINMECKKELIKLFHIVPKGGGGYDI